MSNYEKVLKDSGLVEMLNELGFSDSEILEIINKKLIEREKNIAIEKLIKEYASKMYRTTDDYETIFANFAMEVQDVK